MRSAQELEAELVKARRRLRRLAGVMTFAFIAALAAVFASVGGALVAIDKRGAEWLNAGASDTHEAQIDKTKTDKTKTPPQSIPAPAARGARSTASAPAATTGSASESAPPPAAQTNVRPEGRSVASAPAQATEVTQPRETRHSRSSSRKHQANSVRPVRGNDAEQDDDAETRDGDATARPIEGPRGARTKIIAGGTVRRDGDVRERRRGDARFVDEDAERARGERGRRVIVLDRSSRHRPQGGEEAEPPRQRSPLGGLFGLFGDRNDQ